MNFLRITDDANADDLREAIRNLRAKQDACRDQQIYTEIDDDLFELIGMLGA